MLQYAYGKAIPKIIAIISLGIIGLSACQTHAPSPKKNFAEGPALWTLKDKDTTIHLFGYAPVLKPATKWQTEAFLSALNSADLLVLEADNSSSEAQAKVQKLIPQLGLNESGATLSTILTKAQANEINLISSELGAPLKALDSLRPWLASVQLGVLGLSKGDFDLAGAPASVITTLAKENNKRTKTLEEPTHTLEIMAGFPEDVQVQMLIHAARTIRDDPAQQERLAEAWLVGDVKGIGEILHGTNGAWADDSIYEVMLVQRNKTWAAEINRMLSEEKGTIFLAVGLGHLAGKDSLITMLNKEQPLVQRQN